MKIGVKQIGIVLFCIVLFFTFSAPCYASSLAAHESKGTEKSKVVKVWFGANKDENEVMEQIGRTFTEETGIQVEVVARRAIFDAPKDLVNHANLDDNPDLIYIQAPDIGGLVMSGYLEPISIDDDLRSRYVDTAFEAYKLNGQYWGVGYNIGTSGLIYNKDLISADELPQTWEDFFETAKRLTVKDSSGEIIQWGTLLNVRNMWFVYPMMREYGGYYFGRYSDGTYNPFDVGLDHPGMLRYVEKMKELKAEGLVLQNEIQSESHIVSKFGSGKVAMILYGLWSADYFQQMGVRYGLSPLPKQSDGSPSKPLTTVEGFVINRHSDCLEETESFLRYLLIDEHQQALIEAGNGYEWKTGARNPANLSVISSPYIQNDEILRVLSEIGMECEPFPNIPEGPIWYNYTTTSFGTIFYGDSSGREVDAAAELKELADAIRRDVALMNTQTERIELDWRIALLVGLIICAAVIVLIIWKTKQNRQNPLYMRQTYNKKISILSWCLLLPLLVLLLLFYIYPILHNIYLSFTDYSGIHLADYGLIGLANYKEIFTTGMDGLLSMAVWTFIFALSVVCLSFILGTLVATILDKANVRIAKIYRVIYILPWVIPTVITLLMWQGLLETDGGLINQILNLIGLPSVPWLSHPMWARVSAIGVMTWFSFPYFMVIAFGMLKSIPKDYFEAAKIDGASGAYIFWHITLPLLYQAMVPTLIMSFMMQINQFGIYLLTQGGPPSDKLGAPGATDLLITYIFNTAFNTKRYAVAAAYSVILFAVISVLALFIMNQNKKQTES